MAFLTRSNRIKLRAIVLAMGIWLGAMIGVALWPKFPTGNCPDTPPDTAYVCRVAFGQDFEKAERRRSLLVVLESGVVLAMASVLWMLNERPIRRTRTSPELVGSSPDVLLASGESRSGGRPGAEYPSTAMPPRAAPQMPTATNPAAVSTPAPPDSRSIRGEKREQKRLRRKSGKKAGKAGKPQPAQSGPVQPEVTPKPPS